jgi:acetylornithine deacetylase
MKIRLLTYQFFSGGSNYLESGAVPTDGHIYFWLEAFARMEEEEYRNDFLDFMHEDLERYEEFKEDFPKTATVIRFLHGHLTDTGHPAMKSIRKAYKECGIIYEEKGIPYATDAFAFKRTSNTDVVVMGPKGKNPHGTDEYVEIDSLKNILRIMILTAIDYCG